MRAERVVALPDALQVGDDVAHPRVAVAQLAGHAPFGDPRQALRGRRVALEDVDRGAAGDQLERQPDARRGVRHVAGQQLAEHRAERVDVAPRVLGLPGRDGRGHVGDRPLAVAGPRVGDRIVGGELVHHPEVAEARVPAVVDQHVGGLEVAVEDPLGVGVGERVGDLAGDGERAGRLGRRAAGDRRGQRAGRHVGHHVERPVRPLAHLHDPQHVRVVEVVHVPRLGEEALDRLGVSRELRLEALQRDFCAGHGVHREVNVPHAPLADLADDREAVHARPLPAPRRCAVGRLAGSGQRAGDAGDRLAGRADADVWNGLVHLRALRDVR